MEKCKGINRKGNRCGNNPAVDSEYCIHHQKQASRPNTKPPFYKNPKLFKSLKTLFSALLIGYIGYILYPILTDRIADPISISLKKYQLAQNTANTIGN